MKIVWIRNKKSLPSTHNTPNRHEAVHMRRVEEIDYDTVVAIPHGSKRKEPQIFQRFDVCLYISES